MRNHVKETLSVCFLLSPSKSSPGNNLVSSSVFSSDKSYTSPCVLNDPNTECNVDFIALCSYNKHIATISKTLQIAIDGEPIYLNHKRNVLFENISGQRSIKFDCADNLS